MPKLPQENILTRKISLEQAIAVKYSEKEKRHKKTGASLPEKRPPSYSSPA